MNVVLKIKQILWIQVFISAIASPYACKRPVKPKPTPSANACQQSSDCKNPDNPVCDTNSKTCVPAPTPKLEMGWKTLGNQTHIYSMQSMPDIIWAGTSAGLIRYQKSTNTVRTYLKQDLKIPSTEITHLFLLDRALIMGTYAGGIARAELDTQGEITHMQRLDENIASTIYGVYATNDSIFITQDKSTPTENNPWSSKRIFSVYKNGQWKHFDKTSHSSIISASAMVANKQGHLFISAERGLLEFNPNTEQFSFYGQEQGFKNANIACLATAEQGIYFGTHYEGAGFFDFSNHAFTYFTDPQGPPSVEGISGVSVIKLNTQEWVYFGSYKGFFRWDGTTFKRVANEPQVKRDPLPAKMFLPFPYARIMYQDVNNHIYVQTAELKDYEWINFSLWEFFPQTDDLALVHFPILPPAPSGIMKDMVLDKNNNIWIILDNKIVKYNPNTYQYQEYPIPSALNQDNNKIALRTIAIDSKDTIYTADSNDAKGNRIFIFKNEQFTELVPTDPKIKEKLYYVTDLELDAQDNLFIGTLNGLFYVQNGNWKFFNGANSDLKEDGITSLARDGNTLFMGTNCFSKESGLYAMDIGTQTITKNTDLPDEYRCVHAVETDKRGKLYVGSANPSGFVIFENNKFKQSFKIDWTDEDSISIDPITGWPYFLGNKRVYFYDGTQINSLNIFNSGISSNSSNKILFVPSTDTQSYQMWVSGRDQIDIKTIPLPVSEW